MDDKDFADLVKMVSAISKETNDTRGTLLAVTAMMAAIAKKQGLPEQDVLKMVDILGDPDSIVQNDVRRRAGRTVTELYRIADIQT